MLVGRVELEAPTVRKHNIVGVNERVDLRQVRHGGVELRPRARRLMPTYLDLAFKPSRVFHHVVERWLVVIPDFTSRSFLGGIRARSRHAFVGGSVDACLLAA